MPENSVQSLPLLGKRILVTRTSEQAGILSARLRMLGAIPVEFPTIRIVPPQDWKPLDNALERLSNEHHSYYDWLIFTSVNGVKFFFERLHNLELAFSDVKVAAIGPATATELKRRGVKSALVPAEYRAESVAIALIENARQHGESLAGKRILLARAAEARKVLVTSLQEEGALVDEVAAYCTLTIDRLDERGQEVLHLLQTRQLHILTFTSSSTVRNFMQWLTACEALIPDVSTEVLTRNDQLKIACIGPITSQTARELGLTVSIEAQEFTIDGLVEAIVTSEEQL